MDSTKAAPIDKAGAWHRLEREGRLDAFNTRREQIRSELKTTGMKRKQAAHEAWRLALDEFPPLPVEAPELEDQDQDDGEEDDPLDQDDLEERLPPPPPYDGSDMMWVYHRMPAQSTQEHDAPNKGCWGLLQWARRNRHEFYSKMLPKVVAAQDRKAQEDEVQVKSEPMSVQERLAAYEDLMAQYEAKKRRLGLTGMQLLNAGDGPPRPG